MKDKWTDKQKRIHEGLLSIGQEIAGFYEAGLKIYYGDCPNGSNFLMHAAREIDGGLRDVLSVDFIPAKEEEKHKKSIMFSLGIDKIEGVGEKWYSVSKKLHKYAHRRGAWKRPRALDEVKHIWVDYEDVLESLVGSYYSIVERIEHIGQLKTIEGGPFETLCNILSIPFYSNYFFRKEIDIKWFPLLNKKYYFLPIKIEFDQSGNALFWNVLDYLERVSEQISQDSQYGKELIEIIDSVVQFSLKKKKINNYHIWWYCVKIFNNLPSKIIRDNLNIDQFYTWLTVWTNHSMGVDLTISDIGEKLLPKFFHDDYGPEYKYAEAIIDVITQIKSGGKVQGVAKREDALLAWDSYWIIDSFKKHAKLIGQKCSIDCVIGLANRLKNALEYKQKDYYANIEIDKDVCQIRVSRVEEDKLREGEIGYKPGIYKCIVWQYSEDQLKNIDQEHDFWALHNTKPEIELVRPFFIQAASKEKMTSAIKKHLPKNIKWEKDEEFQKKLTNIFEGLHSDYSHIWFKSLSSRGRDHSTGAEEVLTTVLRDVLLAKCEVKREEGKKILEEFLSEKFQFPIFKRFVLLCVDVFWSDYSPFFDNLIQSMQNILEESDLEVEMQDVLLHHNSNFTPEIKQKIKRLIDSVPVYYVEKGDKKLTAYWKYKWLSPLRENSDFSALYEEAKQKAEPKNGKPYEVERTASKCSFVTHKSPISKEEFLKKPIAEIVKYLNEFKGADSWHGTFEGEPDKEGLANVLQAAVKDDPKKFTDSVQELLKIDYFYLHQILRWLKDSWNDGKDIDWEKIFNLGIKFFDRDKNVIVKEALAAQGEDSGKGKYFWIVDNFVDLIADGCRNDERAFAPKYFNVADKIFDLILPLLKWEKNPDTQGDALTYVLNTTTGRTVMSYVSFSLRVARATHKKVDKWGVKKFERFLPIGIDAYIWFGCYLPQMKYLDEEYTKDKIKYFAQRDATDFEWQMFMEGYLMGTRIYKDLYRLMRDNYAKGLGSKVFEDRVDERLVEHICFGYLNISELLQPQNNDGSESLFWKMLMEAGSLGKRDRWLKVASFFWSVTERKTRKKDKDSDEKLSEESRRKILEFWKWSFNNTKIVKDILAEDYNSFLGRMAELTIILDKIDEEKESWLLQSVPYIDSHRNATFFIKCLIRFEDQESIRRIGKIYKKVLEHTTPTFEEEDIKLIVRRIYEKGDRKDAESICNTYGRRGIHFLKSLWNEFHKKDDSKE